MRAVWLGLALVTSGAFFHSAAAQQVPRFDIEATCRAAPRLLATDPDPYEGCVRDERDAQRELNAMWAGVAAAHRETCAAEAQADGMPSYVDMLTCLQVARGDTPAQPRRSRSP